MGPKTADGTRKNSRWRSLYKSIGQLRVAMDMTAWKQIKQEIIGLWIIGKSVGCLLPR